MSGIICGYSNSHRHLSRHILRKMCSTVVRETHPLDPEDLAMVTCKNTSSVRMSSRCRELWIVRGGTRRLLSVRWRPTAVAVAPQPSYERCAAHSRRPSTLFRAPPPTPLTANLLANPNTVVSISIPTSTSTSTWAFSSSFFSHPCSRLYRVASCRGIDDESWMMDDG